MPKGLDYVINLKDGDFGGVSHAKSEIGGIDDAVEHSEGALGGLKEILGEVGGMIAGVFAVEKIWEFGKDSYEVSKTIGQAEAQISAGIKSTSEAAGLSLEDLRSKAEELEHQTLFSEAQTEQAQAIELSFTNIRGVIFNEAIPAIEDLATRMGGDGPADLKGASVQVGKALQDPITGIVALHRVGVEFTDVQKEMIATDVKHGEVQKAQSIILKELQTEFGGSARAARSVLGPMGDLDEKMEEVKKGFGDLINRGLRVVVPLLLDVMHGVESVAGALADGYHWVKDNADIFKALGIGLIASATAYAILNPNIILGTVLTGAQAVVTGALSAATGIMTAAQWALNVAMDANPIGIIIVGIGALVAELVIAHEKTETFRAVLAGIGSVAEALIPVFKGLGEIILGALTMNPFLVVAGFKDAYNGITSIVDQGIGGLFNKGYNASLDASHKADADKKKEEAAKKGSASDLVNHPAANTPYSISTGKHGKHSGGHAGGGDGSLSLSGSRAVRNVQVTIGKLVERLEVHTTNLSGMGAQEIKRALTELLTEAVHDSELALGSQ
jgi:hypothetical protein